jgi:7-cyano-7-deazaguanine synthase in queuosine biosynthesis
MSAPQPTRALLRCDGATIPPDVAHQSWDEQVDITALGGNPNLTLVVDSLVRKVTGEIDPRVLDLIRIAAYCFAADQAIRRGGRVDVHREGWQRVMTVCLPVADPRFWSEPDRLERLTAALGFATDDHWAFVFDHLKPDIGQLPIRWANIPTPDPTDASRLFAKPPQSVVLFSGGTDSLCALVETLGTNDPPPVVVSHWPARHIKARQDRLFLDVRRRFRRWDIPHVSFEIHRSGEENGDSSQRTRGFLFACLGAAVAAHVGAREVVLADNGYVSVNPPINDQLVGATASRGTHPKFLSLLNHLLDSVFEDTVQVTNPLWDRTRAEALGMLVDAGHPELLALTHSCGKHRHRTEGKPHCGGCSQCVDRRFAVIIAGLQAFDPIERYELDLFAADLPEGEARTVPLSYVRFADQVHRMEADQLFDEYPQLDECLDPNDWHFAEQSVGIADVLKRHAAETLGVVARMYGVHGSALAHGVLPEHALLRLWAGGSTSAPERAAAAYGVTVRPHHSRFVRSGGIWLVDFRDEEGGLKDRAGTRRLARLLREIGREVEALDLVAGTAPRSSTQDPDDEDSVAEEWRTAGPGDAGVVLDEAAVKDYLRRLEELERQIRTAEADDALGTARHLAHERDWLKDQLRAGVGMHHQLRKIAENHERARSTVSKTVWEQVDELRLTMPLLHAHLRRWIRLGYLCWYDPAPPEEWDVAS